MTEVQGNELNKEQNDQKASRSLGVVGTLKKLFSYSKSMRTALFVALIFSAIGSVLTGIVPKFIQEIVDTITIHLSDTVPMDTLLRICLIAAGLYLVGCLLKMLQSRVMVNATTEASSHLRRIVFQKIHTLPQRYFSHTTAGDLLSVMTNDVSMLTKSLATSLPELVTSITQLLICLFLMFTTNVVLSLVTIVSSILGIVCVFFTISKCGKYYVIQQEALGAMNGYVEETFTGHDVLRTACAEEEANSRFDTLNNTQFQSNWRARFYSELTNPVMQLSNYLGFLAVIVTGAILVLNGQITLGVVSAFIIYAENISTPLGDIASKLKSLQPAVAGGTRVFGFLQEEDMPSEDDKVRLTTGAKGSVVFDHVHFSYTGREEDTVIHDFSATVRAGQKVAIVGPSGAGKSTMINLLMRFFELNSGRISIDGHSIDELRRDDIHNLFAMVLQDTWLFEGSIRENLCFNMQGLTDGQLLQACEACGLGGLVSSLPEGLDTVLSDQSAISAGQKQLLTIARAMLQNRPMLILDEATSSVDTRTEQLIQNAMDQLSQGKTSFVIAHRLSTIRNADLILVLKDGDIIEQGTHETLMAKNGFYADLYNSQFDHDD